jgi:hypothetical protein
MNIDDLRAKWCGSMVRTERSLTAEEFPIWCPMGVLNEDWFPGYKFGGEGIVVGFHEHDGKIWLETDWGMDWVIDDQTEIMTVDRTNPYVY